MKEQHIIISLIVGIALIFYIMIFHKHEPVKIECPTFTKQGILSSGRIEYDDGTFTKLRRLAEDCTVTNIGESYYEW